MDGNILLLIGCLSCSIFNSFGSLVKRAAYDAPETCHEAAATRFSSTVFLLLFLWRLTDHFRLGFLVGVHGFWFNWYRFNFIFCHRFLFYLQILYSFCFVLLFDLFFVITLICASKHVSFGVNLVLTSVKNVDCRCIKIYLRDLLSKHLDHFLLFFRQLCWLVRNHIISRSCTWAHVVRQTFLEIQIFNFLFLFIF